MNKYLELLGKPLLVNNVDENDYEYIFRLILSTYSDYIQDSKAPYSFSAESHRLLLEKYDTQSRGNVVFGQGDISKMLDDKIAIWRDKKQIDKKSIGLDRNDIGKWLMWLDLGADYIELKPVFINKYSQSIPYFISNGEDGGPITQAMRDSLEIYSFSKTDIERLRKRLEDIVENKYREYPNWKNLKIEENTIPKSSPQDELSEERARKILGNALDYFAELTKGSELYGILHDSLEMTNEEIKSEGFTLEDYYEGNEDEYDM